MKSAQILPHILKKTFDEDPGRTAIHLIGADGEEALSFHDLLLKAGAYARAFEHAGIQRGEVVVIILEHGADLLQAFLGGILMGVIPSIMPFLTEKLAPERYRESLSALIAITEPAAILTYPAFIEEVNTALREGDSVRVVLDSSSVAQDEELAIEMLAGMNSKPEDIVFLQHSSGTTGLQKGVALSHRAVINQVTAYAEAIHMTSADTVVSWLPLYHDMGLIAGFIMPLLLRSPLVLMSPFDWVRAPHTLFRAVSQYKGTLTWLPNFAYNYCAQKIRDRDLKDVDLSSWRAVINCSEPMRWASHQMFIERFAPYGLKPGALATCYAMAENVFAVTQGGIDASVNVDEIDRSALQEEGRAVPAQGEAPSHLMLSAGTPIPETEVRVLDAQHKDLPERRIGEIALRGNCMLSSYFKRTELTKEAFHDGWYLTGDLGYLADGQLYVSGRKKELIIVGGKNVYPQDLEVIAAEVEGVHPGRVVAFGIFNERSGTEDVVVVAETEAEDEDERQRIAAEIRLQVNKGTDIALRYVQVVDRMWLLKTSSGKVARNANRENYLATFQTSRE